jgi:HAD superfamily hydrolase (TIGR01509 family)
MIKGIIFDFDGVVTDSEPPYIEALVSFMQSIGIDATFEELQHVVGQNLQAIGTELVNTYLLDMSVEEFNRRSMGIYEETTDIRDFRPMEGLYEFLDRCKEKGIRMCVASSSDYDYLYTIMDSLKIRDYFEWVLSGHGLSKGKPDPLIYNMAAEKMEIDKKDLMIIEDSPNGIRAGIASGIYTVGFKGSRVIQDTSMANKEVDFFNEIEL